MRHEQLNIPESYDKVDVAAVWPCTAQVAPLPIVEIETAREAHAPTPAAADVPTAVGILIVGAYAALIAAFAVSMAGSFHSLFMIAISALFVVVYFTVPRIMLGIEPGDGERPSFERFMHDGIDTLTGRTSGGAALAQILIVPVLLTLAILAMGVAVAYYL